ncbi:MAG: choice-of-anchor H family protein [Candidatus Thiodiazotropha sp.]
MTGLAFALTLTWGAAASAEEARTRLSQSVEGPVAGSSQNYAQRLDQAPLDQAKPLLSGGSRPESASQSRLLAHPTGRVFSIADAQAVMSWDDDDDGFYHRLRVSFDPDVSGAEAWVYARLYLSLEGGPWNHYYTTDVFPINGDASDDAYEVVTRLQDGYPTGYYDVLIELYDADYDLLVLNYGPYEDRDLAVLPLEDSYRDSYEEGGGGAMGPGLLLLLLLPIIGFVHNRGIRAAERIDANKPVFPGPESRALCLDFRSGDATCEPK